jgi:S1-C subfamily serine protease
VKLSTKQPGKLLLISFGIAMIVLLAACAQILEPLQPAPASTAGTDEIVATVVAQIEEDTAESGSAGGGSALDPAPPAEVDVQAIVASVLAQVETRLAELQRPQPILNEEPPAPDVTGDELERGLIDLYNRANPAVVFIIVPPIGSGSGFVFSQDGYIVTNNHVVENGREYEVVFAGGERRQAELVGADVDSDLAVIKVDELPEGVQPLPLGSSAELAVGQFVVAIGNPFGEQGSMSLGIVSGLGRSLQSQRELTTGSSYSLPQVVQFSHCHHQWHKLRRGLFYPGECRQAYCAQPDRRWLLPIPLHGRGF